MTDKTIFKSNADSATQHAQDLMINNEFKAIHDFTYASSSATKQLSKVLQQLNTVVTEFSELTTQNSNDIQKISQVHVETDRAQAKKWRNE